MGELPTDRAGLGLSDLGRFLKISLAFVRNLSVTHLAPLSLHSRGHRNLRTKSRYAFPQTNDPETTWSESVLDAEPKKKSPARFSTENETHLNRYEHQLR